MSQSKVSLDINNYPQAKSGLGHLLQMLHDYKMEALAAAASQEKAAQMVEDHDLEGARAILMGDAKKLADTVNIISGVVAKILRLQNQGVKDPLGAYVLQNSPETFEKLESLAGLVRVPKTELAEHFVDFMMVGAQDTTASVKDPDVLKGLFVIQNPNTIAAIIKLIASIPDGNDQAQLRANYGTPASEKAQQSKKVYDDMVKGVVNLSNSSAKNKGRMLWASEAKATAEEKKVMKDHAEFIDGVLSGNKYFTYDKTPVVEATVKNPADEKPGLDPNDITGKDVLELAVYAASVIDPREAAGPGGLAAAAQSAVLRAIAEKDEGKYSGRVSSTTMRLIEDHTERLLGKKSLKKPENQNARYMGMAEKGQSADPTKDIPGAEVSEYVEPRIQEDGDIARPAPRMTAKEAAKKGAPAPKPSVIDQLVGVGRSTALRGPGVQSQAINKVVRSLPVSTRVQLKKDAVEALDGVADTLQQKGLEHLATQIDSVTNSLLEAGK